MDKYIDNNNENDIDKSIKCDVWDTDYNSDNWEPEFMTIFATWQLRVTLDSIRNSCDVFLEYDSSIEWGVWRTILFSTVTWNMVGIPEIRQD